MTALSGTRAGVGAARGRTAGAVTAVHRSSVLELAPLPGATPCARLHTVHILHEWGLRHVAEDAALIVSELVTNAADVSIVLPDRPRVALRLLASEKALVIEVWDHSPLDLEPRETGDEDERGRGLIVVAALSAQWGWQRTGQRRKVIWAQLLSEPDTAQAQPPDPFKQLDRGDAEQDRRFARGDARPPRHRGTP
jgi:anti-sigma regulatory factor (Ser/Thr protein kinase)